MPSTTTFLPLETTTTLILPLLAEAKLAISTSARFFVLRDASETFFNTFLPSITFTVP